MFAKRFFSAVVLLALAGVALVMGGTFLLILSVVVALAGTFELLRINHMHKTVPGCISYISVIGFYLILFREYDFPCGDGMMGMGDYSMLVREHTGLTELWIVIFVLLMLAAYVITYPKYHVKDVALCLLAVLYVGVLVSYVYQTRCMLYGRWFVWLILIGASGSDTFAYLVGRCIGKHHFSDLSPKKTMEGCIGGVLGAAFLAGIYSFFLPPEAVQMFDWNVHLAFVCIGILCSVVSQMGDLAASAIKRNYGVKDYSSLIPGHGGILDRFDSIIFVSPLVYYLLYWFVS